MDLRIALVDDQEADRKLLEQEIRFFFSYHLEQTGSIEPFRSGEAFLAQFQPAAYSIAFLDICMEGMDGIALARRLRDEDPRLLIIFLTGSREYAFDAFPVHPFDYLLKPFSRGDLQRVLTEALRVLAAADRTITVRVARENVEIPVRRLSAAVARGHNVELLLVGHPPLHTTMTFTELQDLLAPDPRFLLCNRGVLVNMEQVLTLTDEYVRMNDGSSFPLRSRGRSELRKTFSHYMLSKLERRGEE